MVRELDEGGDGDEHDDDGDDGDDEDGDGDGDGDGPEGRQRRKRMEMLNRVAEDALLGRVGSIIQYYLRIMICSMIIHIQLIFCLSICVPVYIHHLDRLID